MPEDRKPFVRDLRRYSRQTSAGLLAGFLLILFLVGDGLIYIFYGKGAALMGFLCLTLGLLPIGLIAISMLLIEWMVKRAGRE